MRSRGQNNGVSFRSRENIVVTQCRSAVSGDVARRNHARQGTTSVTQCRSAVSGDVALRSHARQGTTSSRAGALLNQLILSDVRQVIKHLIN